MGVMDGVIKPKKEKGLVAVTTKPSVQRRSTIMNNVILTQNIKVANKQTVAIQYKSVPVMTTEQLAEFYDSDEVRIRQNFIRNANRFEEGKHFFKIEGNELRILKNSLSSSKILSPNARSLILWTEKGAARHAKILETDQAWDMFEQLEDVYFAVKKQHQQIQQSQLPNFADPVAAARAWADEVEAKQLAQQQIAVLEPKAQALDAIADTTNTFCLRDAAKTVGVPERKFIQFLLDKRWIYRKNDRYNSLSAYSTTCDKKVMVNKVTRIIQTDEGEKVYTQPRITAFGLTRLAAMVEKAGLVRGKAA